MTSPASGRGSWLRARWQHVTSAPGIWLLAALAYLPALTAAPGRMPTDTKLYLYLDPGRLIADAPSTWDVRQFAGWVPHQTIAYLWPSGPWFWSFEQIGVPDWIAHRLWIGTLLLLGGLGVRWAARLLGLGASGALVAALVYQLSPYVLPYVSRTTVMLLPWAAVGWLVGLTIRVAMRRSWRDVAWFGLVVLTVGAVNATAIGLIAPAPVLWLVHAAWQRSITWRTATVTAAQLGGVSVVVSLWWIVMLLVQGRHGADVLAFSETLEAVSLTSVSTETLRGLGYWLFYVRDPYAFTTTASVDYMNSPRTLLIGFVLLVICLVGLAAVRWTQRRFAVMLVVTGIVVGVGVHPYADPAPLMAPLRDTGLGLALRSSTRALPLSNLGLALGAGALVSACAAWRPRSRIGRRFRQPAWRSVALPAVVALLAVVNLPALWSGGFVDPALERDQDVPAAWDEAVAALDAGSSEHRVLQLPGSEFGAFRWGYTVDPPLPGLTDKPLVTRDLLPLGSPGAMDLVYALDDRFQSGTVEASSIAAVARFLGADTIWVSGDLAFDRFRNPRPELVSDLVAEAPGLGAPVPFGEPVVNVPDIPMVDATALTDQRVGTPVPPVELVPVEDPVAIVRTSSATVVVAGSGDGIVDAAAVGLLDGTEAVLYAADLSDVELAALVASGVPVVVTDSNRDRAHHWRSSQDVTGLTETGGAEPDATREDVSDQRLEVFTLEVDGPDDRIAPGADEAHQTVARLEGGLTVRASGYGEPFAYRPEDRPAMAVDGDPSTAWVVADRSDPVGHSIRLSGLDADGPLVLLQAQDATANRRIERVVVSASGTDATVSVVLDERSVTAPGQPVDLAALGSIGPDTEVTVTITAVAPAPGTDSGPSAVGFAELGPVAAEYVRPPVAIWDAVEPDSPVSVVLTRERTRSADRWRSDPEASLVRRVDLPHERTFAVTVTVRRDDRAPDAVLHELFGAPVDAVASDRLTGIATATGAAALDGDPSTRWIAPFGPAVRRSITIALDGTTPLGPITLVQPVDADVSRITAVRAVLDGVTVDLVVPPPDAQGRSIVELPAVTASSIELVVLTTEPRTTLDRRWGETVELPVAITEIVGLPAITGPAPAATGCRDDLLTIDGTSVPLLVDAAALDAIAAGGPAELTTCDGAPLPLPAGSTLIEGTPGATTGIQVDRVVLDDGGATAIAAARAGDDTTATVVDRSRDGRTVRVGACPEGCWVVLGEGYNPAWRAEVDGVELGAPEQVSGGFNGWWLDPSDETRTVTMTWPPQRTLEWALAVAALGVVACLVAAIALRSTGSWPSPFEPPRLAPSPFAATKDRADRRTSVIAAAVLVALAAVVIAPSWGAVALVPAAAIVVTRRPRLAGWAAAALAGVLGLLVARRQYLYEYIADAAWPGRFEDLHRAGVFVVVLLAASGLTDPDRRGVDLPVPPATEPIER